MKTTLTQMERSWMPESLKASLFEVELWQWVGLGIAVILSLLVGLAARGLARRAIWLRGQLPGPQPTVETKASLARAIGLTSGMVAAFILIAPLGLEPGPNHAVRTLLNLVAVLALLSLSTAIWDALCDDIAARNELLSHRAERLLLPITRKFVRFVLLTGACLAVLSLFVENLTGVLAGLGLGGLVVALAAKDSVENVFGSLTIMFDMPFALGDWVKIDKVEGVVEEINLRSTRVRTFEDTLINVPNANLIRAAVENYGARRSRRQRLSLRLHYDNKPPMIDQFAAKIRTYLDSTEGVLPEMSLVELEDFSETSIGLLVQTHFNATNQAEELTLRHALMTQILSAAEELGLRFASTPLLPNPTPSVPPIAKPVRS